jgi:hypothetical protein
MRLSARLPRAEFTLLSPFCATGGATNRQGLFMFDCHGYIMQLCRVYRLFNCDQYFGVEGCGHKPTVLPARLTGKNYSFGRLWREQTILHGGQAIVRIIMINGQRRNEFVLNKNRRWCPTLAKNIES